MIMVPHGYRTPARSLPGRHSSSLAHTGAFDHTMRSYAYPQTETRRRAHTPESDRPHTIDVIGNGPETTICGHISLLRRLPLHHSMHRQLLKAFKKKPGNYEGKYNDKENSKASVLDYGNGYLAIHFTDDITRPEMSDFLLSHNWNMMNAHCTTQNGREVIYEKWTNILNSKILDTSPRPAAYREPVRIPGRYY